MIVTNKEGRKVLRIGTKWLVGLTAGDVPASLIFITVVYVVIVWALIKFFSALVSFLRG